jgi:hypothetical protein
VGVTGWRSALLEPGGGAGRAQVDGLVVGGLRRPCHPPRRKWAPAFCVPANSAPWHQTCQSSLRQPLTGAESGGPVDAFQLRLYCVAGTAPPKGHPRNQLTGGLLRPT